MKRQAPIILFVLCAAGLVWGIAYLFKLRFDVGDVYPPYSSLRSDPLGTMAFYESLERMPGLTVKRDYSVENRLPAGSQTAYLHLAASPGEWNRLPTELFNEIERFVKGGGRLAITMRPMPADNFRFGNWDDELRTNSIPRRPSKSKPDGDSKPDETDKSIPPEFKPRKKPLPSDAKSPYSEVSLRERWGLQFGIINLQQGDEGAYEPVPVENRSDLPLPESLVWHSGLVLTNMDSAWQTIYARGTNAVVVERRFNRGSVVIATDSYFVSNEALLKERHADLLAWLVGPSRNVLFDEAHLGVAERPGMATLLRRYRLYWLIGALVVLAGLFIWKNAFSLLPPHAEERDGGYVLGKEASAGLVNLLRRSISPQQLLVACFTEWKKTGAFTARCSAARREQAEAIFHAEEALPPRQRSPLQAYHAIHQVLEGKNTARPTPDKPGERTQS